MKCSNVFFLMLCILHAASASGQSDWPADSVIHELHEVVVRAKQPATRLVGSTLVTSIPGSSLADLGTALDVLAQLPMIKVEDNVVSVIGKSSTEIYVDGRPVRDNMELQQILSSNLKRVELLMAPGAAYESTAGAVLRITTKRHFIQGLSLTDQLQLTRSRKWSFVDFLGLGYTAGNWEMFLDGSLNCSNSLVKGVTTNTLVYNGLETVVGSRQNSTYPTTAGSVKAGFNHAKGSQSWGAYYRYNPEHADFGNYGTEWLDGDMPLSRHIGRQIRAHSHSASLYYEKSFADNGLLHFDGYFRQSRDNSSVATTYPESANPDVNSTALRKSTLWAGKLYLKFPLAKGYLTLGTQDSYTRTSLDYRMLNRQVSQYIPSSLTDAGQTSAAVFASWTRMFGKLSLSVGARYEYVDYDFRVNGIRDEEVSRLDHLLAPDVSLAYSFTGDAQLSLSYKHTVAKPPYAQLTGSLSYTGLHEIEGGNPALHDEMMHNVQLFGMWNGLMFQADFTRSTDAYAFVKQLHPADDLQLLMHPVNVDVSALNICIVWSKPVRRWTPNATLGMYRQWLTLDNTAYDKPIFFYYVDNTFSLPRGWTVTANFNGQTQGNMQTNRFGATRVALNASVGNAFFHKSLTLKLTATDVFNTVNGDWTMDTYGVFVDKRHSPDGRGVSLSVIYNFQPRKSKYKGSAAAEKELERL